MKKSQCNVCVSHPYSPSLPCARRRAFTLVELLVVIAIIGVLAAIIIPVVASARRTADRTKGLSNLRQIAMSILIYAGDNKGFAPAVYDGKPPDGNSRPWVFRLIELGYLNEGITRQKSDGTWQDERMLQRLFNPVTRKAYPDYYNSGGYGLCGFANIFVRPQIMSLNSPSRVVLLADGHVKSESFDWAISGISWADKLYPNTVTNGGANYGFCDGHVQWIKAVNPTETNSAPIGVDTAIFFNTR